MAAPFAKGFSTAVKRARSQDSLKPMESPSANKATKTEEHEEVLELPQFLRQTRAGKLLCCWRIGEHAYAAPLE